MELEEELAKAQRRIDRLGESLDLAHKDLRAILRALALFDGAQDGSPHDIVHHKVIPAIGELWTALRAYGRHRSSCRSNQILPTSPPKFYPCDCGLLELLTRFEGGDT